MSLYHCQLQWQIQPYKVPEKNKKTKQGSYKDKDLVKIKYLDGFTAPQLAPEQRWQLKQNEIAMNKTTEGADPEKSSIWPGSRQR